MISRRNLLAQGAAFAGGLALTGTDLEVDGGLGAFASFAEPYPMETVDAEYQ